MRNLPLGLGRRLQTALDIAAQADIVRLPFVGKTIFFLTHPDDLRHVLQTNARNYRKSFDYQLLAELLGEGILTSEDEIWRHDRRMLQPSFHKSTVARLAALMRQESERVLDGWAQRQSIDIFADMTRLTLTVMGRHLFDADMSADAERIRVLLRACADHVIGRTQAPLDLAKHFRTPGQRRFLRQRQELEEILTRYMRPRWDTPLDDARTDVLETLKRAQCSWREAMDHVLTLFAAGHETTANQLGWAFALLADHPHAQAELARALETDAGDDALDAFLDEVMRLYPAVPVAGREARADDVLGGVPIPKGATLVLFIYGMHHRADLWASPEAFRPERFSKAARSQLPQGAHLPFAAGPRACIGAAFAMLEMQTVVRATLRRYSLTWADDRRMPAMVPAVSLRPARPVYLRVTPRTALESDAAARASRVSAF